MKREPGAGPVMALVAVIAAFVYVHIRAPLEFSRIDVGMTRAEVVARLGEPRRTSPELLFCHDAIPWSGDCPVVPVEATFLYYKYGIDRWVIVGIGADGKVWFRTLGDT